MALKKNSPQQHLGSFLKNQSVSNIDIYFRTGIDPTRISKLSNPDKDKIMASEFYLIALAIGADIDQMANYVFGDFKLQKYSEKVASTNVYVTDFDKFLNSGLVTRKTISSLTNITEYRLSRLSNSANMEPFAKEVYLIALALGKTPSEAFGMVCSQCRLNPSKMESELRERYKASLSAGKHKKGENP